MHFARPVIARETSIDSNNKPMGTFFSSEFPFCILVVVVVVVVVKIETALREKVLH